MGRLFGGSNSFVNQARRGLAGRQRVVFIACAAILPFAALMLVESTARGGLEQGYEWVFGIKDDIRTPLFNYVIYSGIYLFIIAVVNRQGLGGLLFGFLAVVYSVINYNKYQARNIYFSPNDFGVQNSPSKLLELLGAYVPLRQIVTVIIGLAIFTAVLWFLDTKYRLQPKGRLIIGVIGAAAIALGLNTYSFAQPGSGFEYAFWLYEYHIGANLNYTRNGMLASFLGEIALDTDGQTKPDGYSKQAVEDAGKRLGSLAVTAAGSDAMPDKIIVILAESFFDVDSSGLVDVSIDPIPDMRADKAGQMITPTYGGGTANVEFEVLTGFSMYPYGEGATSYSGIKSRTPSYVWQLKELGYGTTAIHTYLGSWYRRIDVYPHLGFDRFITKEDMPDAEKRGTYISDAEMARQILKYTDNSDKQFVFAITMQSHGPYGNNRKGKQGTPELTVYSEVLSEEENNELEIFTQGTYDTNDMFKTLKQHFASSEQNVLLAIFGDHYPGMGTNILDKLDYHHDDYGYHSVFLGVWSNYIDEPLVLDREYSMNYMLPIIYEYSGLDGSRRMDMMNGLRRVVPVITAGFEPFDYAVGDEGVGGQFIEDYFMLEYDALFGGRYGGFWY